MPKAKKAEGAKAKRLQICLPKDLSNRVDVAAYEEYATRSEFIRRALEMYLVLLDERHAKMVGVARRQRWPSEKQLADMIYQKHRQMEAARWLRRHGWRGRIDKIGGKAPAGYKVMDF